MDVGYSNSALTAYTQATCYWFNVPPNQQSGQGYSGTGTSTVHIYKYLCADGYDAEAQGSNVLNDCQSPHSNVNSPSTAVIPAPRATMARSNSGPYRPARLRSGL